MLRPDDSLRLTAWVAFILLLLVQCGGAESFELSTREILSLIGDTKIKIVVHQVTGSELSMINLHDNENTAAEAGLQLLRSRGGRLIELRHSGTRNVVFELEGKSFSFDPNRIFTDQGARKTLTVNSAYSDAAFLAVRTFAANLLSVYAFGQTPIVVTLHNNDEGGYSAENYLKGGPYETDALKVHLAPDGDPDDFLFVTDPDLFEYFKMRGLSAVLQDNRKVTDDGSLSVLAAKRGLPYVNVEAQHGHLTQQVCMLAQVYEAVDLLKAGRN